MSSVDVVGLVFLTVNGLEIECNSHSIETATGKKAVATMNKTGKRRCKTRGLTTYQVSLEVVIPEDKSLEPDWEEIEDGLVTVQSIDGNHRTLYTGFEVETVSDSYNVEGEAMRSLSGFCLDKIKE